MRSTILLFACLPAAAAAAAAAENPYVMPPVAGVCTGNAGVGVGCGWSC